MKLISRILALMVLAALVFLLLELPIFWRLIYQLEYEELVVQYAQEHQLDPALVAAVIKVESNFRSDAVSRSGARGLMQLMPRTARWVVEQQGIDEVPDNVEPRLSEPEFNISLGSWYLSFLLDLYQQDEAKALAAYNAGRGNVDSWIEQGIWDGTFEGREQIPFPETRNYLGKISLAREKYRRIYFR